tara:strand:+ start:206 stop:421 length:216 start_codon:yes stop_codon:yes gene_type:complete
MKDVLGAVGAFFVLILTGLIAIFSIYLMFTQGFWFGLLVGIGLFAGLVYLYGAGSGDDEDEDESINIDIDN